MNSERAVPPVSIRGNSCVPLVWVEAEEIFVARGYIYHIKGRCGRMRDSETLIARLASGRFSVLSSLPLAQLTAMPPRGWREIVPEYDLNEGDRLGNVFVVVKHGSNEYTVVNTSAHSVYLTQGSR